ncbi:MAG: cysteine methyltransferase [Bacteroidetes bacterium]|nr:MAG: cysteine methyltransferase [Bacteroidota bacterium]
MPTQDNFFEHVYQVVKQIPYGRVTTYGAIAEFLGSKGSSRMVGWALNSTKYNLENIPAHRVVNRQGLLTGKRHFGGNDTMKNLLESEGIKIEANKIVHLESYLWNPSEE